jgi:hypothetical protein
MRFAAAAAEKGVGISVPWGHAQGYDLITDTDGVLKRVQVKLACYNTGRDRWDADVRVTRRSTRDQEDRTPCEGGFDILAVIAGGSTYLFTEEQVKGRSAVALRPPGCRPALNRGRKVDAPDHEAGLEAWFLLKEAGSDRR